MTRRINRPTDVLEMARLWKRLQQEQPSAVTPDLESWLALKLGMRGASAVDAADWALAELERTP